MMKKIFTLLALCLSFTYHSSAQCTAEIIQTGQVNVCQNETLTLNATPGGTAYQWMENGVVIPGANADNYDVPTGTPAYYNYTVEIDFNTCTDLSDVTSVYVMQQPIVVAGSNSPICEGQPLYLTANTIPGATYVWSGPNSFTSANQNPTILPTTLADAGTYEVVATLGQCASAPASVSVVVNPVPVVTASNNSPICQGETMNLFASTVPGATYAWTGPSGFQPSLQNPSVPNAQLIYSGTYTVSVTLNGCSSNPATTTVIVNPLPSIPVLSANTPLCAGETLNLSAGNVGTGVTYSWSGPDGYTNNMTTTPSLPNVTPLNSGTYTLTLSSMGCQSQGTAAVQVNAIPAEPLVVSPLMLCQYSTPVPLTATGLNLLWYATPVGGTGTPVSPLPSTNTVGGVVSFYVSQTIAGCESERAILDVTVILCDDVWPGDINWDLTADNNDILDLGLVYGQTGPVRSGASLNWFAQVATDWGSVQVNGMDMKHADCNGDGIVDATDADAVNQNYGMTHMKGVHVPQAKSASLPDLYFDLTGITFQAGTTVEIPIKLGTNAMPMNNILGIAANVKVTNVTLDNAPTISNAISWMGNSGNTIHFTKGVSNNQTDWAYVRIDHTNVSGEGTIAILTMEIPADAPAQDAVLYFDNVKIINSAGDVLTDYNVVDDTATIIPVSITSAVTTSPDKATIVPNPSDAHADLQIILSEAADVQITITDMTGRMVWNETQSANKGTQQIQLPAQLASGIYTIQVATAKGIALPAMKWVKK